MNEEELILRDYARLVSELFKSGGEFFDHLVRDYSYKEIEGMKAILQNSKAGGKTKMLFLEKEEAKEFLDRMKEAHVPYAIYEVKMEDGKTKNCILYRDRDEEIMLRCRVEHVYEKKPQKEKGFSPTWQEKPVRPTWREREKGEEISIGH